MGKSLIWIPKSHKLGAAERHISFETYFMKKGEKLMKDQGLIGDFFCGAGGASVGIEEALGRSVDFAVNHDQTAIKLHSRNHPGTYHMTEDIFTADVEKFVSGKKGFPTLGFALLYAF